MMKPTDFLRNSRSLSPLSFSGSTQSALKSGLTGNLRFAFTAFALLGLAGAAFVSAAQEPSPIPNWAPAGPGTSSSQAGPNQQYGYAQPYDQQSQSYPPPQYGQAPQNYGQQAYGEPDQGYSAPYQPAQAVGPDRLEQMVAPIALYPDNLVSMILAASTYPAQVSGADQWLHMQGGASPDQIAGGANAQTGWDPSVKALTAFPQVLDEMSANLQWTTDLGNAYYNQPLDVMQTIQVMRARAQQAGNLQNTSQQDVIEEQGNIEIAPPTPQVVYVPAYDPWAVYGAPVDPYPGFNLFGAVGSFLGNALISWGPGIAMQAFSATPFGWLGWGLDWLAHTIFFGNDVWCTHSGEVRDWGFARGGARYWGARGEMARFRQGGAWGGGQGWGGARTFRSGLDRGRMGGGGNPTPRAFGNDREWGTRNGGSPGRGFAGNGNSWGRGASGPAGGYGGTGFGRNGIGLPNGGSFAHGGIDSRVQNGRALGSGLQYGGGQQNWQAYNRGPQPIGRPQQFGGSQFAQGRAGGYPAYGSGYPQHAIGGREYGAPSGNHAFESYSARPGSGGGYTEPYRSPATRSWGYGGPSYSGGSNIGRAPSGGGFHFFGGGHPSGGYSYGGGGYKAPRAPSFSSHSWGGGGSFKAPHYGGGGGGHFGGGHSSGGGHSFGGGHSSGGHGGGHHH